MKKFLIEVIMFAMPVVILALFTDKFLSTNLRKSKSVAEGEFTVWNDIVDGKINSDVVVYGSSRAWIHINPQTLMDSLHTTVYNLGIDGHNFWLEYLRHQLLLKYNHKPTLIIYSLDVFMLQKRKDLYNLEQFLPYMYGNKDMEDKILSYQGFNKYDCKIPLLRYTGQYSAIRTALNMYFNPSQDTAMRIRGYQSRNIGWNEDLSKALHTMKSYKVELDSSSMILFDKYISDCKQNNIQLIFVYSPEYIEGQHFVENRKDIMELYKHYSNKYGIPFYDFSADSMSYNKKYFYNASHLNKTGADLFSSRLASMIKTSINL